MTMSTIRAANRNHVYGVNVSLVVNECPSCGIVYGVPDDFYEACRRNGERFYCPNGHSLGWSETDADRERKRADRAERALSAERDTARRLRDNVERERRSAAAYKGHLTRARNRIANGVCPVPGCKRSGFDHVADHIRDKHPDWAHEHPEALDG